MKRKIIITLTTISLIFRMSAQAPQKMSYQAVVRTNSNILITNQAVGVKLSILQGTSSGAIVFSEIFNPNPTTNMNGLISIEVGGGIPTYGTFTSINWINGPYFIKTEIDPLGGTNYSITGISQLLSVPYALYAEKSGSSTSNSTGFTHYIGEQFGGGVVFHLWKDNQNIEHGLIVDLNDISTSYIWGNDTFNSVGISAQSTWNGKSNTNTIAATLSTSAAAICLNSSNGGKNDWYLPSIDEFHLMFHNRFNINKTLSTISGATVLPSLSTTYWTSTEYNSKVAWKFTFLYGSASNISVNYNNNKYEKNYVRAIRSF